MSEIKPLDREVILKSFIENKDFLDKRNAEGIEKFRKGDFTLKFSSRDKKKISVKQKKHKFLFGCNAFMLASFEKEEKEPIYKEKFAKLFNQAVVPFYWSDLEPEEGELRFRKYSVNIYRRPAPDIVLDFCEEYNIQPKGHCLVWNWFTPKWLEKYGEEDRKRILEKRFSEIAAEYSDKIPSWDIVNESATNYNYGRKALFEGYDEFGLELGGKYFLKNRKILNETNEDDINGNRIQTTINTKGDEVQVLVDKQHNWLSHFYAQIIPMNQYYIGIKNKGIIMHKIDSKGSIIKEVNKKDFKQIYNETHHTPTMQNLNDQTTDQDERI